MGRMRGWGSVAAGISFAMYGFAFQKALTVVGRIANPAAAEDGSSLFAEPLLVSALLMAAVCLLSVKVSSRKLALGALAVGLASQAASIGALLLSLRLPAFEAQLLFVFGALRPLNVMILSIPWVYLLSKLNPLSAAWVNAACIILSGVIVFCIEWNPTDRLTLIALLLAAATAACFLAENRKVPVQDKTPRLVFPYKALFFIGAYSFAYGISSITLAGTSMRFAAMIPALLVMALILLNPKSFNIFVLYRLAFPLTIGGFFLIAFIPGLPHPFLNIVIDSGDACLTMLVLLMVCTISYSTASSSIWLFSLLSATQFAAQFLGNLAGGAAAGAGEVAYGGVALTAMLLVVITSIVLASEKNLFSFWEPHAAGEGKDKPSPEETLQLKLRCISVVYGLTDRETEIVSLAANGLSNHQIARDMFISEGTVKVHFHHVYQKTGVHSRKELLELIQHQKPEVPAARG